MISSMSGATFVNMGLANTLPLDNCNACPICNVVGALELLLRYATQNMLLVPRYKLSGLGQRAFRVAGPLVWNPIADCLRDPALELAILKRQLKTLPAIDITYRAH